MVLNILMLLNLFTCVFCDWTDDWMIPLQQEIKQDKQTVNFNPFQSESVLSEIKRKNINNQNVFDLFELNGEDSDEEIKRKLEKITKKAKVFAEVLEKNIKDTELREYVLKDTIVNGRHGVTTVKVLLKNQIPRWYIVKDGQWIYCDGFIQDNANFGHNNLFSDVYSKPKCIGQTYPIERDPCAFNSLIKYETLPEVKLAEYTEIDYLCLNYDFNATMGQYLSVPKKVVNKTCKGLIRSLEDNIIECGERTLSEYTFYPSPSSLPSLPLEYCTEQPSANRYCKLLVGWSISNMSLNNFVYFKDDVQFKTYFMDVPTRSHKT